MGVCNCSMFCCTLLCVRSSIVIILMGKRKLVALLNLSSWCLVMVEWPFLAVPQGCLQLVIVVFPGHTYLLLFVVRCLDGGVYFFDMKYMYNVLWFQFISLVPDRSLRWLMQRHTSCQNLVCLR